MALPGIGSGGGSCTHGGKAYEAHLNLILPAVKLVESVGDAPTSTCLQGSCIPCLPRPQEKLASRPGAAPGRLSFGDPAAQAGARLIGKLKGPGVFMLPARAISTKNKHLLAIYSIPARGFTAAVSVFRGTPPPKPFNCKIWSKRPGACFGDQWAHPIA